MILAAALAATPFGTCAQPARGIAQVTDNQYDDVTPNVSGDHLVWRGFDGHDWEIYHRIGASTTALTDNALDDGIWGNPPSPFSSQIRVSGSHVAWCGDVGNYYELFVHNGLTTTQVTRNNVYDHVGGISDGRLAFTSERVRAGLNQDLYLFDGTTTRHIATGPLIGPPSISGNIIAWDSGTTYAHLEIFVYDGTEIRQVSHTGSAVLPRISGRRVVWEAERNNGKSLYSYDVDTAAFLPRSGGFGFGGPWSHFIRSREHWDIAWAVLVAAEMLNEQDLSGARGVLHFIPGISWAKWMSGHRRDGTRDGGCQSVGEDGMSVTWGALRSTCTVR